MSALKRNLKIVWDETTNGSDPGRRYVAKSFHGGSGWGVFDRAEGKFLRDREVATLDPASIRDQFGALH